MRNLVSLLFLLFICSSANSAGDTAAIVLKTPTGNIYGTIKLGSPLKKTGNPIALIIPGSGPVDRNGNNLYLINDAYLALADSLARHGISSVRYDKRGIGASKAAAPGEEQLRFGMYIDDAEGFLRLLRRDKRFSRIFIAGHSEGALIGSCVARKGGVAGLISIAGAGQTADAILLQQLKDNSKLPKAITDTAAALFGQLKNGTELRQIPKTLYSVFRPSVQPYMASWMKYDPAIEMSKVKVPVLIIQGTTDLQVDTLSAHLLSTAKPDAEVVIVPGMNHIMRNAPIDRQANFATYNNAGLSINQDLINAMVKFVQ